MSSISTPQKPKQPIPNKRVKPMTKRAKALFFLIPLLLLLVVGIWVLLRGGEADPPQHPKVAQLAQLKLPDWVEVDILPKDSDSRRGVYLEDFTGIAVHYVGNPGTGAKQNRAFYGNPGTTVNSHFLIGLEGEIIQCLPLAEKSSATSERNRDTISIEVCHPDEEGVFLKESYDSLVKLSAWLCEQTDLTPKDMIRHFDVTGKLCPLYYVEHPEAWEAFLMDVEVALGT